MSDTDVTSEPQPIEGSPTPADVAARTEPKPEPEWTPETAAKAIEKARKDAATYREKLREVEPLAKKAQEAEEANKTEIQRAVERAEAAEKREAEKDLAIYRRDLADEHHIPTNKLHLIGSGSREEMAAIAAEIGPLFATSEKTPPPPSNRPVEGLRPGASPEAPKPADDSYPAAWAPPDLRDKESRSIHGQ
jgi:hypothetical protein